MTTTIPDMPHRYTSTSHVHPLGLDDSLRARARASEQENDKTKEDEARGRRVRKNEASGEIQAETTMKKSIWETRWMMRTKGMKGATK